MANFRQHVHVPIWAPPGGRFKHYVNVPIWVLPENTSKKSKVAVSSNKALLEELISEIRFLKSYFSKGSIMILVIVGVGEGRSKV